MTCCSYRQRANVSGCSLVLSSVSTICVSHHFLAFCCLVAYHAGYHAGYLPYINTSRDQLEGPTTEVKRSQKSGQQEMTRHAQALNFAVQLASHQQCHSCSTTA